MCENITELLIDTVREYPVLYDTANADYKNIRIKNKLWDNIAGIIGESDGETLKNKWKNLRDAYSKHLRSRKPHTGQAAKLLNRYKSWPWVKQMSFLRPYLKFAPLHPTTSHQNSRRMQAVKQNKAQVNKVIKFLNNNNKRYADFDDIDLIFLGYAKTIKKMTVSRQARIKLQFAKIIMESELDQAQESSLTTDSKTLHSF